MSNLPNWNIESIEGNNAKPYRINNSNLEDPLSKENSLKVYSKSDLNNVFNEFSISNNQNVSQLLNRSNIVNKKEYLKKEFEYKLNENIPHEFIDNIFIVKSINKYNTKDYILFEFWVKSKTTNQKKLYGHLTFHKGRSSSPKGSIHYVNESRISSPRRNIIRLKRVKNSILKNIEFKFMRYNTDSITKYILEIITPVLEQYYLSYELSE